MKNQSLLLFLLVSLFTFYFKTSQAQLHINPGTDTATVEHKAILKFWNRYLKSFPEKNSLPYLEFWAKEEKERFPQPDLCLYAINTDVSVFQFGRKTVLSVLPFGEGLFQINTSIANVDSNGNIDVMAIVCYFVESRENDFLLRSPLFVRPGIHKRETDVFKLYTKGEIQIPDDTLQKLNDLILNFKNDFDIQSGKKLNIIYGRNSQETDYLLGFDFNLMSSTNNPSSGISDSANNLIVLKGLASILHEATHIYLNPLYPNSPLLEGLATFYGGSMGKSLDEGIIFLRDFIAENPDVDLYQKLLRNYYYISNKFNPIYTLQGMLIQLAYNKDKVKGIQRILSYKSFEDVFQFFFELKKPEEIDAFLKKELNRLSH